MNRPLDPRHLASLLLAAWGCHCGSDALHDVRPRLLVSPEALDFKEVLVGDLKVLGLDLSNPGQAKVHIASATFTSTSTSGQPGSAFAFGSAPPMDLVPGQKVSLPIAFQPPRAGHYAAKITFVSNGTTAMIDVPLAGIGVEASVVVDTPGDLCDGKAPSIAFGKVRPGMSVDRDVHVRVLGSVPVNVLSAVLEPGGSSEFSIDGSQLPKKLAGGDELALKAHFQPTHGGPLTAAFVITTDSPKAPSIRIPVCGTGVAPALCAHPVPLDLGPVVAGQSAHGRLTLESCGTEPVAVSALALSSDAAHMSGSGFSLSMVPAVPMTLQPMQTADVEVTFSAMPPFGAARAWVLATSNAEGMAQSYFPVVAATAMPCALSVAPSALTYRNVSVGMSATQNALVLNSGQSPCAVASITVRTSTAGGGANDFMLVAPQATPLMLAPGESHVIPVAFSPSTPGAKEGTLAVTDAAGTPLPVALHGNPDAGGGCQVDIRPSVVSFGVSAIGSLAHRQVTVDDVGDQPCRIVNTRLLHASPEFIVTPPMIGIAFPMIGPANIDVGYAPTSPASSSDVLEIDVGPLGGGTATPYFVGLSGSGGAAQICVTPAALDFGTVPAGTTSAQSLTISSCGSVPIDLRGILLSTGPGAPFSILSAPAVPSTLPPGVMAMPQLSVSYQPQDMGPHFGQIEIISNDPHNPTIRVPLSGNRAPGCDSVLQCSPASVDFGNSQVGTSKTVRVVCKNLGARVVTVSAVSLNSGASPDLHLAAPTPVMIVPGDAWTFDVVYTPAAASTANAMLSIASDACVTPQPSPVSGSGFMRNVPMCQPPSTFMPVEKWSWHSTSVEPSFTNVWSTPLVAPLTDTNHDGHIDENDIPAVIFVSIDNFSIGDPAAANPGILRVLAGDTGAEIFSITNTRVVDTTIPAVGDLDGDGKPEIVAVKWTRTPTRAASDGFFGRFVTGTLVCFDHQGNLLWESEPYDQPSTVTENGAAVTIADLDQDGFGEVIFGHDVFDHRGHLKWRGSASFGEITYGVQSIVADIDLDGHPELIAGGTVYRADGSVVFSLSDVHEGGVAVGMLDPMDPFPEIAIVSQQTLKVVDHLGVERWHAALNAMGLGAELPTIADLNGDGFGEIAVADSVSLQVFHGTGGMMWSAPVPDSTPCCIGVSAFDFEGDGASEVIAQGSDTVFIFRGSTGDMIFSAARPNITAIEIPVVADVDNDGHADLLVTLFGGGQGGVRVYSNTGNTWVAAPRIWNQQSYDVRNVEESGVLPRVEMPFSMGPRVFRASKGTCR